MAERHAAEWHGESMKTVDGQGFTKLLDEYPGLKLLTLDCFNTLVWRKCASSSDVYAAAMRHPKGVTSVAERVRLEAFARAKRRLEYGDSEPCIEEFLKPHEVEAEMWAERRICFRYEPMWELAREANRRGIKVAVVSDTYFSATFLLELMNWAPGTPEILVFTSCGQRVTKSQGLLAKVCEKMRVDPSDALHVGDDERADYAAAVKAGMNARLFQPFSYARRIRERCGVAASLCLDERLRRDGPVFSAFKLAHAFDPETADATKVVGRCVLGPIVAAFAEYVRRSATRPMFLMRDAWLVQQACASYGPAVHVSRFVATAAAMQTLDDARDYLAGLLTGRTFSRSAAARQLLLEGFAESPALSPVEWCTSAIAMFDPEKTKRLRKRMLKHVVRQFGELAGEGIQIDVVDLGYEGTFERKVGYMVADALKAPALRTKYLICLPVPEDDGRREGLLDKSRLDTSALLALSRYVAPLELLFTSGGGSVVDYTDEGEPVLAPDPIEDANRELVREIQQEALEFARQASVQARAATDEELYQAVLQGVAGLLHLPGVEEVELMRRMRLDANLGTDATIHVVSLERALVGLRRRGIFYQEAKGGRSMGQAAELRAMGTELALAWTTIVRHQLELHRDDLSLRYETVLVQVGTSPEEELKAWSTFDGYFVLDAPNPDPGPATIRVSFPKLRTVQIESVAELAPGAHETADEVFIAKPARFKLRGHQHSEKVDGGIIVVGGDMIVPGVESSGSIRVVFRPIARQL